MPAKKIAFYGPVRGSGVTTLITQLFHHAPSLVKGRTALVDCDVEFPTASVFFSVNPVKEEEVKVFLPNINRSHCILCKACAKSCAFDAIKVFNHMSYIRFDEEYCRACGACLHTCHYAAITEHERVIGISRVMNAGPRQDIIEGELYAEDFFAVKSIQGLMAEAEAYDLVLVDARGGLDYISLEAMHQSDIVVIVIDHSFFSPGPYRQILDYLACPTRKMIAVLNRARSVPDEVAEFCNVMNIPVAGCLPYDFEIPFSAVKGELVKDDRKSIVFRELLQNILSFSNVSNQAMS